MRFTPSSQDQLWVADLMVKAETDASTTRAVDHERPHPAGLSFRANPLYGTGAFRRRVRLTNQPGIVHAELEDCVHGFRLHVEHDGTRATAIAAEALRIPLTTCMESERPLKSAIGCPLTVSWDEFQHWAPAAANCTYLRDLLWWSLAHAQRTERVRDYEIAVADEDGKAAECSLWRNGDLVLRWHVRDGSVVAPAKLANRPLMRGFSAWATSIYRGDALEAATVLQRGYFVSRSRRVDMRDFAGMRATAFTHMHGTCFTFSPGAVERAVFTAGADRDFTDTPELLLKFI